MQNGGPQCGRLARTARVVGRLRGGGEGPGCAAGARGPGAGREVGAQLGGGHQQGAAKRGRGVGLSAWDLAYGHALVSKGLKGRWGVEGASFSRGKRRILPRVFWIFS